jgi:hypothetical protein
MVPFNLLEGSFSKPDRAIQQSFINKRKVTHHSMKAASALGGNWICSNKSSSESQSVHLAAAHSEVSNSSQPFNHCSEITVDN